MPKFYEKQISFISHAEERFVLRNIPMAEIRRFLRKGVIVPDAKNPERKLCIYRESKETYYTMVFQEFENDVFIVTGWPSKEWEKKFFEKVKRNVMPSL